MTHCHKETANVPAPRRRRPPITLYDGLVTLNAPTGDRSTWRVNVKTPTGWKNYSGGKTETDARNKAEHLLGGHVAGYVATGQRTPTFAATADEWLAIKRSTVKSSTADRYHYVAREWSKALGDIELRSLSPAHIRAVDLSHLSREAQNTRRTVLKGILEQGAVWLREAPAHYVRSVHRDSDKGTRDERRVDPRQVPSLPYVNNVLTALYWTMDESIDQHGQGAHDRDHQWATLTAIEGGTAHYTQPYWYRHGLPADLANLKRRGTPKHYRNHEARQERENREIRSLHRRLALVVALGAGAGLRIGEVLALRIRHLMTERAVFEACAIADTVRRGMLPPEMLWTHLNQHLTGSIHITEQASQASRGKVRVTLPKSSRTRTAWLPQFLPRTDFSDVRLGRPIDTFTREDYLTVWEQQDAAPLRLFLVDRLHEIFTAWAQQAEDAFTAMSSTISETMLFPTRNRPRKTKDGLPNAVASETWAHYSGPDTLTGGTYQTTSNFTREMNYVYDYMSKMMSETPPAAQSRARRGYSHHSLRHLAISLRVQKGQPMTEIADEFGHADAGFTLTRYSHVIHQRSAGFEFMS
ncbi:integrase [Micrococcus aloeverae]